MFLAGDEFCNTQFGNNNPYCQDNEISWLDWTLLEANQDMFDFFSYMIAFRRSHPAIRRSLAPSHCKLDAISVHRENPFDSHITADSKMMGVLFAGRLPDDTADDIVYLAVNVYWEPLTVTLPPLPNPLKWHLAVNTAQEDSRKIYPAGHMPVMNDPSFRLGARSVAVFTAARGNSGNTE